MRTYIQYHLVTFIVFNTLESERMPGDGQALPSGVLDVTDRQDGPWLGKVYSPGSDTFSVPAVVETREGCEKNRVRANYETWQMWKLTRAEAVARGLGAGILTALQNRENAAWSAFAQALQDWAAAS